MWILYMQYHDKITTNKQYWWRKERCVCIIQVSLHIFKQCNNKWLKKEKIITILKAYLWSCVTNDSHSLLGLFRSPYSACFIYIQHQLRACLIYPLFALQCFHGGPETTRLTVNSGLMMIGVGKWCVQCQCARVWWEGRGVMKLTWVVQLSLVPRPSHRL